MHVDDWIDNPGSDAYASFWLDLFRLPAAEKMAKGIQHLMDRHRLYCTWRGARRRVVGCSRMGDVWLAQSAHEMFAGKDRVDIDECSDWSAKP